MHASNTIDSQPVALHADTLGTQLAAMRRELFSHAMRLVRDVSKAEDLVQDTVERALRFEDRFEPGTNLRAWAHHILFNVHITKCRRNGREVRAMKVLATDPCAWTLSEPVLAPSGSLSRSTWRAIDTLPQPFRSTVLLIDVQEASYKDAADQLGIPIGTVMSRLHRARRLLAEALKDSAMDRQAA